MCKGGKIIEKVTKQKVMVPSEVETSSGSDTDSTNGDSRGNDELKNLNDESGPQEDSDSEGSDEEASSSEEKKTSSPSEETSSSSEEDAGDQSEITRKKKWSDAGLALPCSQVHRFGKFITGMKIEKEVSVYFASAMEFLNREITQKAVEIAAINNKKVITSRHIMETVKSDPELNSITAWKNSTFRATGVCAKGIHSALLPPPKPVRRRKNDAVATARRGSKRVAQDNQPGTSGTQKKRKMYLSYDTSDSDDE